MDASFKIYREFLFSFEKVNVAFYKSMYEFLNSICKYWIKLHQTV